jgi:hypothetical protein
VTVRAFVRLAVLGVLTTALSACSGSATAPTSAPPRPPEAVVQSSGSGGAGADARSAAPTSSALSYPKTDGIAAVGGQRPEFHGTRELLLRRGHQVTLLRKCVADPSRHHVCEAAGDLTYVAYGPGRTATLTDAVMAPALEHTAWVVRMGFARSSMTALNASATHAAETDEFLLVLDSRQRVLVPLDLPAIRGTTVTFGPVTKTEAWDLVERLDD